MIRFCIGLGLIIAGVAAVEGSASLAMGILIASSGIIIMLSGLGKMAENGDIV
jgi:hypothetical protein